MHADSIAISRQTPPYPSVEITDTIIADRISIIFAIIVSRELLFNLSRAELLVYGLGFLFFLEQRLNS